ncbi:MAG: hypothetical protein KDJ37_14935 [Hyphomicrobiaceae bacterium]|nr:hypothetical protein [Hyphomicrobiaceae bacterium]
MTSNRQGKASATGKVVVAFAGMAFAVMAVVASTATAQEPVPRFQMKPTDDGFVRLDTQTGAVSLCARANGDWACRAMADDQKTLQDKIARLEDENRSLREENRRLEDVMGLNPGSPDAKPGGPDGAPGAPGNKFSIPSEKDIDKAFDYFEGMLKKFRERLEKLEEPAKKKNEGVPL